MVRQSRNLSHTIIPGRGISSSIQRDNAPVPAGEFVLHVCDGVARALRSKTAAAERPFRAQRVMGDGPVRLESFRSRSAWSGVAPVCVAMLLQLAA